MINLIREKEKSDYYEMTYVESVMPANKLEKQSLIFGRII